jgi:hypothetical protein
MEGIPLTLNRKDGVLGTNTSVFALLRDRERSHYILIVVGQKGSPTFSYPSKSYFWSPDGIQFFILEDGYDGTSTQQYEMINRESMVSISQTHKIHVGYKIVMEKKPEKASAVVTVADPKMGVRIYDQIPCEPNYLSKVTFIVPNDSVYIIRNVARFFKNNDILVVVYGACNYEHHVMKIDAQTFEVEELLTALNRSVSIFKDGGTMLVSAGSESLHLPSLLTGGNGSYTKDGVKQRLIMDWDCNADDFIKLLRPRFPLLMKEEPKMIIPFK